MKLRKKKMYFEVILEPTFNLCQRSWYAVENMKFWRLLNLNIFLKYLQPSGWRKIRNIVQWTPFFQTYKKQRYPWVQLAGHQGNFKAGPEQGTVLKKLCPKEEDCFQVLMKDVLRPYVPEYKGQVTSEDGERKYFSVIRWEIPALLTYIFSLFFLIDF